MYADLINDDHVFHRNCIWKLTLLAKIKEFMRYLDKGVILTKQKKKTSQTQLAKA